MPTANELLQSTQWTGKVPHIKQGQYSDGMPYNEVSYLSFKLILKPNRFTSRASLFDFAKVIKRPAKELGIECDIHAYQDAPIQIREVLFIDTSDFRLYNNAFILRRRVLYEDGFPMSDPEIVFKFRHPDIQKAAEMDVRPHIEGDYRVKFKCQVLPLKEKLGGSRLLFSHNVQFPRTSLKVAEAVTFDSISKVFPVLEFLRKEPGEKIQLVNETIIEEVLQDIALYDFGDGITARANVGIWRTRGQHRPLIAEFAYQFKFADRNKIKPEMIKRAEAYFLALQYAAKDWIALDATKTGIVYRLLGNQPKAHE